MEALLTAFDEADADKDGLLNKEEFRNFMQKEYEYKLKTNGGAVNLSSMIDHWFMACNTVNVAYAGVKKEDLMRAAQIGRLMRE